MSELQADSNVQFKDQQHELACRGPSKISEIHEKASGLSPNR